MVHAIFISAYFIPGSFAIVTSNKEKLSPADISFVSASNHILLLTVQNRGFALHICTKQHWGCFYCFLVVVYRICEPVPQLRIQSPIFLEALFQRYRGILNCSFSQIHCKSVQRNPVILDILSQLLSQCSLIHPLPLFSIRFLCILRPFFMGKCRSEKRSFQVRMFFPSDSPYITSPCQRYCAYGVDQRNVNFPLEALLSLEDNPLFSSVP